MRVLVADDEAPLAELVARGLRRQGMAVDTVFRGDDAEELLTVTPYDVVILDRDLPGMHGDDVARRVHELGTPTRILMLTAAITLTDRVTGLELGADDYMTKPFEFPELVARVRALGRRASPAIPPILERRGIHLDTGRRIATSDGMPLDLTAKELGVLEALLSAGGRVVSAEELLERVWDANIDPFTAAVRVTMSKLRAKLRATGRADDVITTHPGHGYSL
ncbi:response regulator transcription factor [Curtobacterium ammoniigenes]|uniref:response regulator transcription factor n=1 Tax=Curtobacterium ammoniigenes TaxID=395387 RepID=UPI00083181B7|nr:response regulator transcription factor [Curtobacterium ammoniigenes]